MKWIRDALVNCHGWVEYLDLQCLTYLQKRFSFFFFFWGNLPCLYLCEGISNTSLDVWVNQIHIPMVSQSHILLPKYTPQDVHRSVYVWHLMTLIHQPHSCSHQPLPSERDKMQFPCSGSYTLQKLSYNQAWIWPLCVEHIVYAITISNNFSFCMHMHSSNYPKGYNHPGPISLRVHILPLLLLS